MDNEIEFKVKLDSVMIIIVAIIGAAVLFFNSPGCGRFIADTKKEHIQQPQECFGPLQKFVEEELVCK